MEDPDVSNTCTGQSPTQTDDVIYHCACNEGCHVEDPDVSNTCTGKSPTHKVLTSIVCVCNDVNNTCVVNNQHTKC